MCVCCCDILVHCDILMLILGWFIKNIHKDFLIRCYVGFAFDVIEYVILRLTVTKVDNEQFVGLFAVFSVFILFISIYRCFKENVYMFIFMMFFKCTSLSVAIMIFRASSDFEWGTINKQLSSADFSDTLLATVIIVSFVDIWLNLGVMILQLIKIMCVVLQGRDTFCALFVKSFDRFGRELEPRRFNNIFFIS